MISSMARDEGRTSKPYARRSWRCGVLPMWLQRNQHCAHVCSDDWQRRMLEHIHENDTKFSSLRVQANTGMPPNALPMPSKVTHEYKNDSHKPWQTHWRQTSVTSKRCSPTQTRTNNNQSRNSLILVNSTISGRDSRNSA